MKLIGQTAVACYHYLILSSMASKPSSSVNGESRELHLLKLRFLVLHTSSLCLLPATPRVRNAAALKSLELLKHYEDSWF